MHLKWIGFFLPFKMASMQSHTLKAHCFLNGVSSRNSKRYFRAGAPAKCVEKKTSNLNFSNF